MAINDTTEGYGIVSRLFHWAMAAGIFALFALGWWMVGLDYYSPYYTTAPDFHKSAGMLLLFALFARFAWRLASSKPDDRLLSPIERRVAPLAHWALYALMFAVMISGYLIPTAKGQPIDVFGILSVPAIMTGARVEEFAGLIHEYSAYGLMVLAALHTAAALKHHFHDRTPVLTRMWSGPPRA